MTTDRQTRTSGGIHIPKMRWGGRWSPALKDVPHDGEWHMLATYARTTGYQVARSLNIARSVCDTAWEFGARQLPTTSELHVRWRP